MEKEEKRKNTLYGDKLDLIQEHLVLRFDRGVLFPLICLTVLDPFNCDLLFL